MGRRALPFPTTSRATLSSGQETATPISGGEHEYTHYGFMDILDKGAMDIIQPDLRRCGGFTVGRKIAALAESAGVTLIPHAYGAVHIQFALSQPVVPMVEHFPLPVWDSMPGVDVEPIFHGEPEPANGRVSASALPGLGVSVNERIFA